MRVLRRVVGLVVLLAVVVLVWVGVRGYLAVGHLDDAAARVPDLQAQLTTGDVVAAGTTVSAVQDDVAAAHDLTSDPVWRFVERCGLGGQNLAAVGEASDVGVALSHDGLPAAVAAATAVRDLRSGLVGGDLGGASVQAQVLSDSLATLQASRDDARGRLDALDRRYLLPPVSSALVEVGAALDLTDQIESGLPAGG